VELDPSLRVHLQPIYGVVGQPALCYLLEVDGLRLLLDCGWDETFDEDLVAPLAAVIQAADVDAVLLSHSSVAHIGALPYLMGRLQSRATVYAALPVHRMGQLALYDAILSRSVGSDVVLLTLWPTGLGVTPSTANSEQGGSPSLSSKSRR
jgi:cleavage and polyadenylation specificity factor subunit 2